MMTSQVNCRKATTWVTGLTIILMIHGQATGTAVLDRFNVEQGPHSNGTRSTVPAPGVIGGFREIVSGDTGDFLEIRNGQLSYMFGEMGTGFGVVFSGDDLVGFDTDLTADGADAFELEVISNVESLSLLIGVRTGSGQGDAFVTLPPISSPQPFVVPFNEFTQTDPTLDFSHVTGIEIAVMGLGEIVLDSFSAVIIPEPGTLVLLLPIGLSMLARHRRA